MTDRDYEAQLTAAGVRTYRARLEAQRQATGSGQLAPADYDYVRSTMPNRFYK